MSVVLAGLFVVLAGAKAEHGESSGSALLGLPAPEATGTLDDGSSFDLSRRKGSWVVLNFFDPDCIPCQQEHRELAQFVDNQAALGNDGAELYSVITQGTREKVDAFFDERGGDWPQIYSKADEFPVAFGVVGGARDVDHRSERRRAAPADLEGHRRAARHDPAAVPRAVHRMSAREWNKAVKRWPGWLALVFVVAGFLAVGAFRSTGPETPADRVDAIAQPRRLSDL